MTQLHPQPSARVWPGLVLLLLGFGLIVVPGWIAPGTPFMFFGMMGGVLGGLLLLIVWWGFFSRIPMKERWLTLGALFLGIGLTFGLAHASMPSALFFRGLPAFGLAFIVAAWFTRNAASGKRRWTLFASVILVGALLLCLRSNGVRGGMEVEFAPRWSATDEQRLGDLNASGALAEGFKVAEWPRYRGVSQDGTLKQVTVETDWSSRPPELLWRRNIGPGWGSFTLAGDQLYTQEQRGENELVVCYRASTGEPIWTHADAARFEEALAGPGPRSTPTLADGRVYSFGATGILNALNAQDGQQIWQRDAAADTLAPVPDWGFAASPLVVDGLVIVHTGGPDGKGLVAYDALSGEPRWFAPSGALSYSSAQLATIAGVRQLVMLTGDGASGHDIATGASLWTHEWPMAGGARIVQPAFAPDGDLLIGTGFGMGVRRVALRFDGTSWSSEEKWTSAALKPYFNDFVVRENYAYGFDGRIMAAIDLATGERVWKGGRYGHGQALLLDSQALMIVLSEKGELALVRASPERFEELAKIQALDGKTWNHPILVDGVLYVRNGSEMAAFRLAPKGNSEIASRTSGQPG